MTLPNFLIIGAAKCGTTALYHALNQHPQIYMSPVKEPRFFALEGEMPLLRGAGVEYFLKKSIVTLDQYQQLFANAGEARARGEASPIYLSCFHPRQTAQTIRNHVPDIKMIALLRQPAKRIWSAFCHGRRRGIEPFSSLEKALAAEDEREKNHWLYALLYRRSTYYDVNLAPFIELFERDQLRVYLYDEWNAQPKHVLQEIFHFLAVDESFEPDVSRRRNVGWMPRNWLVEQLCRRMEERLPEPIYRRSFGRLHRLNRTYPPISPELHRKLTQELTPNIHRLEEMLGRDLSHWLVT